MLKIPEHLSEKQKAAYKKAWLKTFDTLIGAIKILVFFIAVIMIYIPFGSHFRDWFKPKPSYQKSTYVSVSSNDDPDKIKNGIHLQTGLAYAPGFDKVRANCTVCHSAKLITQNRATKEGWGQMIDWMQKTQGLWDLGPDEDRIISYLATNYAPEQKGRRDNLDVADVEWYILNLGESD